MNHGRLDQIPVTGYIFHSREFAAQDCVLCRSAPFGKCEARSVCNFGGKEQTGHSLGTWVIGREYKLTFHVSSDQSTFQFLNRSAKSQREGGGGEEEVEGRRRKRKGDEEKCSVLKCTWAAFGSELFDVSSETQPMTGHGL